MFGKGHQCLGLRFITHISMPFTNWQSHSMSLSELLDWSAQEAAFTPARSERFQTPPPTQVQVADDEDGWRLSAA